MRTKHFSSFNQNFLQDICLGLGGGGMYWIIVKQSRLIRKALSKKCWKHRKKLRIRIPIPQNISVFLTITSYRTFVWDWEGGGEGGVLDYSKTISPDLESFFSKILGTDRSKTPDQDPNPTKHFSSINQNFL
jgi:hypothetical protein